MVYGKHYSVFFNECIKFLDENQTESNLIADLTFGAGGHSFGILEKISDSKIIAVDQDNEAIQNGLNKIQQEKVNQKINLVKMNFSDFPIWFKESYPNKKLKGILIDLGVSSHQFDTGERGFSFKHDGPLDMRMNTSDESLTAFDVINEYPENDIADIFYEYGEEKFSRRIAAEIIKQRNKNAISTTKELENIIFHCYPQKFRHGRTHPATRCFQALRIYVNRELEVLEKTILALFQLLDENGRLLIISFHSLEDRIVKHKFKEIYQSDKKLVKILTKKPLLPSDIEVEENARSRSAKLRVIEKISTTEGKYGKDSQKKPETS